MKAAVKRSANTMYHKVFMPMTDIFDEAGPDTFKHLERLEDSKKNLVILNYNILNELHELEHKYNSVGAADSLTYIKELKGNRIEYDEENQYSIYRISEGLELMLLESTDYSYSKLDPRTIFQKLKETKTFDHFAILTGDSLNHIKYDGKNGLTVEDPEFLMVNENIIHEGIFMVNNEKLSSKLFQSNSLPLAEVSDIIEKELFMNQFLRLNGEKEAFARVTGNFIWNKDRSRILEVKDPKVQLLSPAEYNMHLKVKSMPMDRGVLGVTPRDMEQYMAMQYTLLNNDVSLTFLCGKAGSGKTLLSYAAAVDSILDYQTKNKLRGLPEGEQRFYDRIILMKPPEILGGKKRDPGALPGSLLDKLSDHLKPYSDAHRKTILRSFPFDEMFRHPKYETKYGPPRIPKISSDSYDGGKLPQEAEAIELRYSGFIGGSSIDSTFMIVDEAQDFSPYELKTIIERVAERTKIVICGDPKQTRNPKCNVKKNGLTYAIKHFLPKNYTGLVYLPKNYRSAASEDAESLRVYNTE